MNVICNAIGHTRISEDGIHTECYHCGGSKVHDNSTCEPCPWVPDAKCVPFDQGSKETVMVIDDDVIYKKKRK